jgi:hypothetical protein
MKTALDFNKVEQLEVRLGDMAARGLLDDDFDKYWKDRAATQPGDSTFIYLYPIDDDHTAGGIFAIIYWVHTARATYDDIVEMLNAYEPEKMMADCKFRWVK